MKRFKRLLSTDFRNVRTPLLATAATITAAHLVLLYLLYSVTPELFMNWFQAMNALAFAASVITPIVLAFTVWSNEWKGRHHLLLLSLPVPKAYVLLSKGIVIFAAMVILLGVETAFFFLELTLADALPVMDQLVGKINAATLVSEVISHCATILLVFFTVLLGRSVRKLSGVVTFLTFILLLNVPSVVTFLLEPKAESPLRSVNLTPGTVTINGGDPVILLPLILNVVLGGLYLIGSLQLLNRKIEA